MMNRPPQNKWEYENHDAITEHPRKDFLGIKVDTEKAKFRGVPYKKLDARERRKWENMLVIGYPKHRLRISYH